MAWEYKPTEHLTHCGLCGSPRSSWLFLCDRDRAGYAATSVICRHCGLVFLTPRMTAAGYADFYGSGAYRQIVEKVLGKPHDPEKMHTSQRAYARDVGNWLAGGLPRIEGGSMLDIGGSNGIVAAALKERFGLKQATVLEPSQSECCEAADRGLCGEVGSFETWEPGERSYDVIGLFQTVDHLLDIGGSLAKIKRLLAPDGFFVVDIVNFAHLLRGFRRIDKAVKIDHPTGLIASTMASFLLRAGFEIIGKPTAGLGGRKIFFLCRHGEPQNVLPDRAVVDGMLKLIGEVRYAKAKA